MIEDKPTRTELSELGEFGLINHLASFARSENSSTLKGIGDDAAVIDCGDKAMVITTDLLVEGVHFDLSYMPFKHLGYKAVVVNLSDVYAMNAIPTQITVSLAMSNRFPLETMEELYQGIRMACDMYGVDLIGGDTSSSKHGLMISVTAVGFAPKEDIVYRSGAKENDLICVTGDLGAAYMGLQLLEREKQIFLENPEIQPDLEGNDYILERQLKPEAGKATILKLKELGIKPTAMIDVSDGLSSDLLHICDKSKVGCAIYSEKIPVDHLTYTVAESFNLDPTTCALNGGEDYELLFTISQADFEKIKDFKGISVIGHITNAESGKMFITNSNQAIELTAQGWNAMN